MANIALHLINKVIIMSKVNWIGICIFMIAGLFTSCEEEVAAPTEDWGYRYFPTAIGMEWQYALDSIVLRPIPGGVLYDSVRLYARETLVDTIRDLEGQLWYRGERYDRRVDSTQWRFSQTFLLRSDVRRAYRQEDNLTFVKMVFPPDRLQRWDGHVAFDAFREIEVAGQPIQIFADWDYRYTDLHQAGTIMQTSYDSLTTVQGADYENLLNRRLSLETYAPGIGLVYRELEVFETQCQLCCNGETGVCIDLPWREKAEAGFIIRQWLLP
ncbi:MAG: hypothetical protein R2795_10835 [Saprospiraceae bacterium]